MLLAGWGPIGIDVSSADNLLQLISSTAAPRTQQQQQQQPLNGAYLVSNQVSRGPAVARDPDVQDRLWDLWQQQTGLRFPIT